MSESEDFSGAIEFETPLPKRRRANVVDGSAIRVRQSPRLQARLQASKDDASSQCDDEDSIFRDDGSGDAAVESEHEVDHSDWLPVKVFQGASKGNIGKDITFPRNDTFERFQMRVTEALTVHDKDTNSLIIPIIFSSTVFGIV